MIVRELRKFLDEFEDNDEILTMVHDNILGTPYRMYRGYFALRAKDDEGIPVLYIYDQQKTNG